MKSLGHLFKAYARGHHGISKEALARYSNGARNMTRSVIEERPKPFREIDVFSRLMMDRIIYLGSDVHSQMSNVIVAQLLFLDSVDHKKPIHLYINSPGGGIYAGLAIYDTMQYIQAPVATICVGLAASMGAILLTGGAKGQRSSLPHSRAMMHQPLANLSDQGSIKMEDLKISVEQIVGLGDDLYKILAHHTGQPLDKIREDASRDYWMRAEEAKAYGLIDHILTNP